jgi:hypothetical protein
VKARTRYAVDAVLWTATHLDDFLWALVSGVWAYAVSRPERPVYELLARLVDGERPADRRVRDLPRRGRYVVMSDHHLLYTEAPHDYFGSPTVVPTFQNERIYARLATHYGHGGWTLIENGDVEDLVVPEPAFDRSDCLRSGVLSRLNFGWDVQLRLEIRKRQLARIVLTYAGYYDHLLLSFGRDRIVKLIGNHDTELLRSDFADLVPLGVDIGEFVVIGADDPAGGPPIVVCHGHQMDSWTCTATAQQVGESITESFAWAGQGADRIWDRGDWGPLPLRADNRLVRAGFGKARGIVPKLHHMSETRVDEGLAALGDKRPWLVLGHTHEPRFRAAQRYVNAAAAGRYQDLVWAAEIVDGAPKLVAWWVEGGELFRGELAEQGDELACVARQSFGPLPPLPYPARPASLDEIRMAVDAVAPARAKTLGWLVVRIALNAPIPLALLALVGWAVAAIAGAF